MKKRTLKSKSNFSFFTQENMSNYMKVQESYFQNYIQLYGIDVELLVGNLDYYNSDGSIRNLLNDEYNYSRNIRDFSYFKGPEVYGYKHKMNIKAILDYGTDNFMFTGFGLDTTNDGKMFITKKQFNQYCLQYFGLPKQKEVNLSIPIKIVDWKYNDTIFEVPFEVENDLTYKVKLKIGETNIDTNYVKLSNKIIDEISFPSSSVTAQYSTSYENNKFVEIYDDRTECYITDIKLNKNGRGKATLFINFTINYNSFKNTENTHYDTLDTYLDGEELHITFAPKVGDIVRLRMLDNPNLFRDYSIEFVNDVNLEKDALTPYISSFCWECSISRRKPSHEDIEIPNTPTMEKGIESVVDFKEMAIVQDITAEEEVYNYNEEFVDVEDQLLENMDYGNDVVFGGITSKSRTQKPKKS